MASEALEHPGDKVRPVGDVTFIEQSQPVDEYGRALYAVARSIVRAQLDQLSGDDLTDLNCDRTDVTMRQLAKVARLDRDKGMRGDGFEWAVHEAIVGGEPRVVGQLGHLLTRLSPRAFKGMGQPESLLFGYERRQVSRIPRCRRRRRRRGCPTTPRRTSGTAISLRAMGHSCCGGPRCRAATQAADQKGVEDRPLPVG